METRKNRTPSARMLASKQDDPLDKVVNLTPIAPKPTNLSTIASQLAKVGDNSPIRGLQLSAHPVLRVEKELTPLDEEIDISNELERSPSKDESRTDSMITEEMLKEGKIDAAILNGAFPVANEVTISSQKYNGRPSHKKYEKDYGTGSQRTFTGETLNLRSSDLSIPNKAAHFLYFRCYEEGEVQKEFPLTIDEHRKGPQNFLVEPRVGLKNTDYYIDSYLWNRGKSTSSKKKIFVEIDGNHVKTSRRSIDSAHYLLNWYYSNMENRICKKVCWLESVAEGVRTSPVLVQYHVNYLSDNPIEMRKTPKLYSDTRTVAQELLRSDSPLQTVARFVETGETDPREIINKKQAYEMRRYVMASARRKTNRKNPFDDVYYQDEYGEVYFDDHNDMTPGRGRGNADVERITSMACRSLGRKLENRITTILDNRFGPHKLPAEILSEWINTLVGVTADDYDITIHTVVASMRKQLEELIGSDGAEFLDEAGTSDGHLKRRIHDDDDVGPSNKQRFEGEQFIFEGDEYVEEEVIAEDIAEEVVTTSNGEPRDEVKFDQTGEPNFFFPRGSSNDVVNHDQ